MVLVIAPWSYPFQLSLAPLVGAISAGNKVVLKPSELTPKTSEVLRTILLETFPPNEVVVVEGGVTETENLLKEKFDYIFFTGSTFVGKLVMKAAAEHLTPVTLELGGKSPCLIDDSAQIDIAAKRCTWGKFLNAGQTCVAPDYVLVPSNLQDQFIERMKFHLEAFYGENPNESEDYPKIINERHFDRLTTLIPTEKLAYGGKSSRDHLYFGPTILKNVSWDDLAMKDEIFGPVLPIIPYTNFNDVLAKLSSLPKPLAFYFFSESANRKKEVLQRLSFGGGCINDTIVHLVNPYLPFGGVGASGMGNYHGKKSFETFTNFKSIYEQTTRVDIPVRYPPYKEKLSWLKFFLR